MLHEPTTKLDSRLREVLDELARSTVAPLGELPPALARQQPSPAQAAAAVRARQWFRHLGSTFPEPIERVEHRTIPSVAGRELPLRLYIPHGLASPCPILVYFHSGCFVIGDLDRCDSTCRALANRAYALVVAVGYHQAPEYPFPAAPEDAFAGYAWTLAHAAELGGDPALVAVGGECAGGTLATVVCLMARDRGVPLPLWQLLMYPMLDRNFNTSSCRHHAQVMPLATPMLQRYWAHYLADPADAANPYATPLRATDLRGLPPATFIGAWIDPVWSEGTFYMRRLREVGVRVAYHDFPNMTHDFVSMTAVVPQARQAIGMAAQDLEGVIQVVKEFH
jgi:acetyl esterase